MLQLANVDRVDIPARMTLAHVSASVRDVPRAIRAIRTIEPGLLPALEFLVVRQAAFAAEDAGAVTAGKPPVDNSRRYSRGRRGLEKKILRGCRHAREYTVIQACNTNRNTTPLSEFFVLALDAISEYRDGKTEVKVAADRTFNNIPADVSGASLLGREAEINLPSSSNLRLFFLFQENATELGRDRNRSR